MRYCIILDQNSRSMVIVCLLFVTIIYGCAYGPAYEPNNINVQSLLDESEFNNTVQNALKENEWHRAYLGLCIRRNYIVATGSESNLILQYHITDYKMLCDRFLFSCNDEYAYLYLPDYTLFINRYDSNSISNKDCANVSDIKGDVYYSKNIKDRPSFLGDNNEVMVISSRSSIVKTYTSEEYQEYMATRFLEGEVYFGASVVDLDENSSKSLGIKETAGVMVYEVLNNSPAQKVGIKKHDVIKRINDQRTDNSKQFARIIKSKKTNDKFTITVLRKKQIFSYECNVEKYRSKK